MTEEIDSKADHIHRHKEGFECSHIKCNHPSTHGSQSSNLLLCINNERDKPQVTETGYTNSSMCLTKATKSLKQNKESHLHGNLEM